jgi:phenylalanyl-tRNA synthetase beta chain
MLLERLGFLVETRRGASLQDVIYKITVPSWRATGDVAIPEDIVEEIVRLYGYDRLKDKTEMVEFKKPKFQFEFALADKIKNYLSLGCGLNEVFNYPWLDANIVRQFNLPLENFIAIANPPAEENKFLQTSLIPNLLKNIDTNIGFFKDFKIFELARVFQTGIGKNDGEDNLPHQPKYLSAAFVGGKEKEVFLEAKGVLEKMSEISGVKCQFSEIKNLKHNFLNQEKNLDIICHGKNIGWLGEMKEKIKGKNVALFEINFSQLVEIAEAQSFVAQNKYTPIPTYPAIERDLAFELDWGVKWGNLCDVILSEAKDPVVKKIDFLSEFDLGLKKSVAFRITYQADRTLTDEEVKVVEEKIVKLLEKKFNARLRAALGK